MDYEAKTEETPFTPEMEAGLRQIVRDRAAAELERLAEAIGDDEAFVHLPRAAAAAFNLEQFDAADHLAQRALALAPRFRNDWNYGNAVHLGHTVLGLLALQTRDLAAALAHLHVPDPDHSIDERRQLAFGMSYAARVLAVISTERQGSRPHSQCVKGDSK